MSLKAVFGQPIPKALTRPNIKQVFHHYEKWEDFKAGQFRAVGCDMAANEELIGLAMQLLSNTENLYEAMTSVTLDWVIAAETNLTNRSINRRAWLGQAACCYEFSVPEDLTKAAWWRISTPERDRANGVADRVITEWEDAYVSQRFYCA